MWGYARAASSRGVDIIENCEVTGFRIEDGAVSGVETTRGFIGAKKVIARAASSAPVSRSRTPSWSCGRARGESRIRSRL
jgi:glycine/D-amino acid oxidase-like deaminating enzyme